MPELSPNPVIRTDCERFPFTRDMDEDHRRRPGEAPAVIDQVSSTDRPGTHRRVIASISSVAE